MIRRAIAAVVACCVATIGCTSGEDGGRAATTIVASNFDTAVGPVLRQEPPLVLQSALATLEGHLRLADGCLYVQSDGRRRAIVWPAYTNWNGAGSVVPGGNVLELGARITAAGAFVTTSDHPQVTEDLFEAARRCGELVGEPEFFVAGNTARSVSSADD